jgi:large subunit ribosomal protein L1
MNVKDALAELKKSKERKFDQSIDLIINLKGIDLKRANIAAVLNIPHKVKEKKVCGFLTKRSDLVKSIGEPDFKKYKDKALLRNLVNDFDFFIASASLMPKVATSFGKSLGPMGKMPSPQLGILTQENDEAIKIILEKISKAIKIRVKEPSVKVTIGKQSMKDEEVMKNIESIYKGVVNLLPTKKENVKSILLKLTMSKPVRVEI